MKSIVTIAIPAYKVKYLKGAIDSALAQTYSDIEVIVVDDCSPHDVRSVVDGYDDSRLKYYRNEENLGAFDPARNWNRCLELAKGEFFCLLCDDDIYEPEFVETLLGLAHQYPSVDVFRSRVSFIDAEGRLFDMYPSSPEFETACDYLWAKVGSYRIQTISEFMYRTAAIRTAGGFVNFPKAWCADEVSVCNVAKDGGIAHTNKLLVRFRMSGDNITSRLGENTAEKIQAQNMYSEWIDQFIQAQPEWFRTSLLKHRAQTKTHVVACYLAEAGLKEFASLAFTGKRGRYQISAKCILKSLLIRSVRLFKKKS